MLKIREDVDLKELEKFGFRKIKSGEYVKSLKHYIDLTGNKTEIFICIEENRDIVKYRVYSYLHIPFEEKRIHDFKRNIKDLIQARIGREGVRV